MRTRRRCEHVRRLAATLAPSLPASNFRAEAVEEMSFPDGLRRCGDLRARCCTLRATTTTFTAMLRGTWRVLRKGGLFFCRLASSIGMEERVERVAGRRFRLPDGSERYLVDEALLMKLTAGNWAASCWTRLKTTVVQNQRSMTTWVMRKGQMRVGWER